MKEEEKNLTGEKVNAKTPLFPNLSSKNNERCHLQTPLCPGLLSRVGAACTCVSTQDAHDQEEKPSQCFLQEGKAIPSLLGPLLMLPPLLLADSRAVKRRDVSSTPRIFSSFSIWSFCHFLLFLQAIAAAARRWLEGEASRPKFNCYPTKPGSSMTNLAPGPSNTTVKTVVRGDLLCSIQKNPQGSPELRASQTAFTWGSAQWGGEDSHGCFWQWHWVNEMQVNFNC